MHCLMNFRVALSLLFVQKISSSRDRAETRKDPVQMQRMLAPTNGELGAYHVLFPMHKIDQHLPGMWLEGEEATVTRSTLSPGL